MSFYDGMAGTAASLLASYGAEFEFTRTTHGTYDPATLATGSTISTFTANGAVVEYRDHEIDGSRVLARDKKLVCPSMGTLPEVGDTVPIFGQTMRVHDVVTKNPAGTVIAIEMQLRI